MDKKSRKMYKAVQAILLVVGGSRGAQIDFGKASVAHIHKTRILG